MDDATVKAGALKSWEIWTGEVIRHITLQDMAAAAHTLICCMKLEHGWSDEDSQGQRAMFSHPIVTEHAATLWNHIAQQLDAAAVGKTLDEVLGLGWPLLFKNMYVDKDHLFPKIRRFGLSYGQCRAEDHLGNSTVHNGVWYNKKGEHLGYGDLSWGDLRKIHDGLQRDEFFVVLSELDVQGDPDFDIDTLAQKAVWVIGKSQLYHHTRDGDRPDRERLGMVIQYLGPDQMKEKLTA